MARRDDLLTSTANDTVIAAGVRIKGNLESDNDIGVDGALEGNIKAGGNITIGVNAIIKGTLSGVNITIGGQVFGNIKASGEVIVTESGRVEGDIVCTSLAISAGAIFLGTSKMTLSDTMMNKSPKTPAGDKDEAITS
jgi:cytoskeletal protein CcmA (bactofilin family)